MAVAQGPGRSLGATQWETLWRTVIPMASPGIMTGLVLVYGKDIRHISLDDAVAEIAAEQD